MRKASQMGCPLPLAATKLLESVSSVNPSTRYPAFFAEELSLGNLAGVLKHLRFAGAERPATPLHFHIAMGREIVTADRMDQHLLWTEADSSSSPQAFFLTRPLSQQLAVSRRLRMTEEWLG